MDLRLADPDEKVPQAYSDCFVPLFVLPLMVLALLDIAQGGEDLLLEWSIVWFGVPVVAACASREFQPPT